MKVSHASKPLQPGVLPCRTDIDMQKQKEQVQTEAAEKHKQIHHRLRPYDGSTGPDFGISRNDHKAMLIILVHEAHRFQQMHPDNSSSSEGSSSCSSKAAANNSQRCRVILDEARTTALLSDVEKMMNPWLLKDKYYLMLKVIADLGLFFLPSQQSSSTSLMDAKPQRQQQADQ